MVGLGEEVVVVIGSPQAEEVVGVVVVVVFQDFLVAPTGVGAAATDGESDQAAEGGLYSSAIYFLMIFLIYFPKVEA